jgi:hypothetical protein
VVDPGLHTNSLRPVESATTSAADILATHALAKGLETVVVDLPLLESLMLTVLHLLAGRLVLGIH